MSDFNTLKILARQVINRLEQRDAIEYAMKNRHTLTDNLAEYLKSSFMTTQEIKDKASRLVDEKSGLADEAGVDLDNLYAATQKDIISEFEGEMVGGLYLIQNLKEISGRITSYMMSEDLIEDVFLQDDEIEEMVLSTLKNFDPSENA